MRHLIDPTDLTVEETERIVALAEDIIANRASTARPARAKNSPRCFTSLPPARA